MSRVHEDWVDGFIAYTASIPSPVLFRKWSAIAAVAGALERRVWVRTMNSKLFATMYTVLVAPPGVGKSVVTSQIRNMWAKIPDHCIAGTSLTKASLIDDLRDAARVIVRPQDKNPTYEFNSLKAVSNELGVLIPSYDNEFMNVLTDIYDGHGYSERRRSKDLNFSIDAPQINLLAATTPAYLSNVLPEGAWDQGFLSRTMLVYSGEVNLVDPFAGNLTEADDRDKLQSDLNKIGAMFGEMQFEKSAADAITKWHMSGGAPAPDHPKLIHYLTRRTMHLLKLCMVASASEGNTKVITKDHFGRALDWLIELEGHIPDIFKAMKSGGDSKVMEETWYTIYKLYLKQDQKPVPERNVVFFLQQRVPAHSVDNILRVMVSSGLLKEKQLPKLGKHYIPLSPDGV